MAGEYRSPKTVGGNKLEKAFGHRMPRALLSKNGGRTRQIILPFRTSDWVAEQGERGRNLKRWARDKEVRSEPGDNAFAGGRAIFEKEGRPGRGLARVQYLFLWSRGVAGVDALNSRLPDAAG